METRNQLSFSSQELPYDCGTGTKPLWQTQSWQLPAPVQEAQGALLGFLSPLLAGSYLEASWKALEYLQDCSKL